jgi:3-deoxy-7-phosphoheptulonate synthase
MIALDAIRAAQAPHHFMAVTKTGRAAIARTTGNEDCHTILRGGKRPNYHAEYVSAAVKELADAGIRPRIMIDFSHGNSAKDARKQSDVGQNVAAQVAGGEEAIFGVMVESHLKAGRQDLLPGKDLVYGLSITDACLGWEDSLALLELLADAARKRRSKAGSNIDRDAQGGASLSRVARVVAKRS